MTGPDESHTISLTFEELAERTRCGEYSNGMDFSSDPGSHRHLFYDHRVDIADQFIVYYTSIYGEGMKFTANPLLGLKWREEYELEWAHSSANISETLWAIAKAQVPLRLKPTCDWFRKRARERMLLIATTQRENLATYLQLEKGKVQEE